MKWRDVALGFLATLVIWQVLSLLIARPVFPPPMKVLVVFVQNIFGDLGRHFLVSAGRVVAANVVFEERDRKHLRSSSQAD